MERELEGCEELWWKEGEWVFEGQKNHCGEMSRGESGLRQTKVRFKDSLGENSLVTKRSSCS